VAVLGFCIWVGNQKVRVGNATRNFRLPGAAFWEQWWIPAWGVKC
jgi:hypothetical protein